MNSKDEIMKALEELKKVLEEKKEEHSKKPTKEQLIAWMEEAKEANKGKAREGLQEAYEQINKPDLENFLLISNKGVGIGASRFEAINLFMELIQYLVEQKVLNKEIIEKAVDIALNVEHEEFKKNVGKYLDDMLESLMKFQDEYYKNN